MDQMQVVSMLLIDVRVPSWMEAMVKLAHLSAPLHGAFSVDRLGGGSICNSAVDLGMYREVKKGW